MSYIAYVRDCSFAHANDAKIVHSSDMQCNTDESPYAYEYYNKCLKYT